MTKSIKLTPKQATILRTVEGSLGRGLVVASRERAAYDRLVKRGLLLRLHGRQYYMTTAGRDARVNEDRRTVGAAPLPDQGPRPPFKLNAGQIKALERLTHLPNGEESPFGHGRHSGRLASAWHRTMGFLAVRKLVSLERYGDHYKATITPGGRSWLIGAGEAPEPIVDEPTPTVTVADLKADVLRKAAYWQEKFPCPEDCAELRDLWNATDLYIGACHGNG